VIARLTSIMMRRARSLLDDPNGRRVE